MRKHAEMKPNKLVKYHNFYGNQHKYIDINKKTKISFWSKVKRFFRKLFITALVILAIWITIQIIHSVYPNIVYKVVEKEVVLDNLKVKIDQLKGELVNDIFNNEKGGANEEDALITWDPNPNHKKIEIASIGSCQYKIPTLQEDWLKHRGEKLTRKQAVLIALSDEKCKEIMSEVITEELNGWQQWYNSGVKFHAKERLQVISELQK